MTISRFLARCAGAACLAACIPVAGAAPAGAATARSPGTRAPAQPATQTLTVTSLASAGPGTLADAIRLADSVSANTRTVVRFAVSGTINLSGKLLPVTRPVTIDGRTAPGYRAGGPPVVEVNCHRHPGLVFTARSGGSALWALSVTAASGNGVTLDAGRITLNRNYIGLTPAGRRLGNGGAGVFASARSAGDRIGLHPARASGVVGNVISGNDGSGLVQHGSSGDTVEANRIGANPAGTARLANGGNGLLITARAHGNEIGRTVFTDSATGKANNPTGSKGTTTPVFVVPPLGNLISGNLGNGVLINGGAHGNTLNGNFVGTDAKGDAAIGNSGNGVWIDRAPGNSLTGCKFVNNPFVYYNVVSGNGRNGLRVTDSADAVVQGNFFGTGADNTTVVRNARDGIRVDGTSAGTQVGGVIPLGNVSAGNGRNGIEVTGRVHGFITFNTFGGLHAFKGAAPNGNDGVLITATGGDNVVRTNVFSGNDRNGIEVAGNASRIVIDPDIVGLNTKGNGLLPNHGDGVLIHGTAHEIAVGGFFRSVIPQNTFSGNRGYGLVITGHAYHNAVFTSDIGTETLGINALGNRRGGVLLAGHATRNVIGFPIRPRRANLISGNTGNGVTLSQHACENVVVNNRIGVNRFGRPLPNSGRQLVNNGCRNVILGNHFPP